MIQPKCRAGAHVLLVEDNPSLKELYAEQLTQAGYRVETLVSGEQAIAWLGRAPRPEALILDICLAGMDGIATMRKILEKHPQMPVILHSAYPDYRGDFSAWCADAFLLKSTDQHALARCLEGVLEARLSQPEKAG